MGLKSQSNMGYVDPVENEQDPKLQSASSGKKSKEHQTAALGTSLFIFFSAEARRRELLSFQAQNARIDSVSRWIAKVFLKVRKQKTGKGKWNRNKDLAKTRTFT